MLTRLRRAPDGTLLVEDLVTGPATVYGPDGKAIARDPGQIRFQFTVDTLGTPDPEDDFLDFLGSTKESTGRSDPYCESLLPALQG